MAIANKGKKVAEVAKEERTAVKPTGKLNLAEQGKNILYAKSEEEMQQLGSKSDTLEFVALITNPWFPVTRREKGEAVKGEETVGAIIKNIGKDAIQVATIPNKTYKVMDVDFEKAEYTELKPGEEAKLNSAEVAELLTRDEYGSLITGGGKEVSYTTQNPRNPADLPTTKLRIKDGSVKDHSVSIATVSEDGKTKTIKPEFEEKFNIFSTRGTRRRSVGSARKPKANPAGVAVQQLFKKRLGK